MSNISEKTLNNNLRTTYIMNEMKWELALKLLNEFDSKKTLTKINDPEGGDVYIYFSPNDNDYKDLSTVDKWQWYNNRNKTPFPTKTNVQIYKIYYDSRSYNSIIEQKTNSIDWRKRVY